MFYAVLSYFRLGAVFPRAKLRELYPEPSRITRRARGELAALLAPVAPPVPPDDVNVIEFPAVVCTELAFAAEVCTELDFTGACMCDDDATPRVGDTGTKVIFQVLNNAGQPVDVSAGTVSIKMKYGFDPTKTYTGVVNTDGVDGKVYFLTLVDTWDVEGVWQGQADALVGGKLWHSRPVTFTVGGPNL